MHPVETPETREARGLSRRKLLKRAAVGGGMLVAAPAMTSTAYGQTGSPNCRANPTPGVGEPVKCNPGEPCLGQTPCGGEIPAGSFCTCIPGCKQQGNQESGRCFCHEVSLCAGLTPCESASDCPPGWACAESCCPGCNCLPPCGTNPVFGTMGALHAASGSTSAG